MAATLTVKLIDDSTGTVYTGGTACAYVPYTPGSEYRFAKAIRTQGSVKNIDRYKGSFGDYYVATFEVRGSVYGSEFDRDLCYYKVTSNTSNLTVVPSSMDMEDPGLLPTRMLGSGKKNGTSVPAATGNITIEMHLVKRITVQFYANGGSGGPSSITGGSGTSTTIPTTVPTKSGSTFVGWSTSPTASSAQYSAGSSYTLSNSGTLYAVWSKNQSVNVTFDANGGSGAPGSISAKVGQAVTIPSTTPTKSGATFNRWNATYASGTKHYFGENLTLYAKWTKQDWTLTLSSNNTTYGTVTGAGTYGHGTTVTVSANPNKRIAGFESWSDGGEQIHNVSMTQNRSVSARFIPVERTLTYGVQNSSGMGGYVIHNGGESVTSSSSTKSIWGDTLSFGVGCNSGCKFKRWAVYYKTIDENGNIGDTESIIYPTNWGAYFIWSAGPVNISSDQITTSATGAYVITKIMAEFEKMSYTISTKVAKTPSSYGRWDSSVTPGTVTGAGIYQYGTSHSYKATANPNYTFTRWNDNTTDNPKTATVTGAATYTAYFTGVTKTLTLIAASVGRGTITFMDGGGTSREYGTQAKLKATPADHYKFVKWSDGSTDAERTVNVSGDASFQAEFVANDTVTINTAVTPSGGGTVTGGGSKIYDSSVTLVATPSANWEFVSWQDGLTTASRTFTANSTTAAVTYTATFRKAAYQVSATGTNCTVAKAIVSGAERSAGIYEHGTVLKLTVTPAAHYHFTQWSDGDKSNPRQVTVTAAASYSATASIDYHNVSATSESSTKGSVSVTLVSGAGSAGSYTYGSVIELVATPTSEYQFYRWSDGDTNATRRITVDSDKSIVAQFKIKTYTVTVAAGSGGTVSIVGQAGTSATFDYGASVTILATAAEHYSFSKWSDNTTDNPKTFTVTGNHTFTASFAVDKYTVTAKAGTGGSVTGTGQYDYGSKADLVATADAHYTLLGWYDSANNLKATTAEYSPTVTGDATYTAKFALVRHMVSVSVTGNGAVTGAGEYEYGATATLTATANEHNHFVKWTSGGVLYSTNPTITPTVSSDLSFTAVFAVDMHIVTTGVVDAGTGSVTAGGSYPYGTDVSLTATPAPNYHFVEWYRNEEATGIKTSVLAFVVEKDVEYKAKFAIGKHVISASVVPVGCGASVGGTGKYDEGETAWLEAHDYGHYTFDKWSDGVTTRLRGVKVTGPMSFTAQFKLRSYTLTAAANDNTKGSVTGGGTYEYTASETVKLEAKAASNCHFLGWKKNSDSSYVSKSPTLYVSVEADATYTAYFEVDTYTITTSAIGPGTVTRGDSYAYGTTIQLVATAENGYAFSSWSDGDIANPRTVTVTGNASFTALFVKQVTERGRVFAPRHPSLFW